jgi:hypothetical protein
MGELRVYEDGEGGEWTLRVDVNVECGDVAGVAMERTVACAIGGSSRGGVAFHVWRLWGVGPVSTAARARRTREGDRVGRRRRRQRWSECGRGWRWRAGRWMGGRRGWRR